MRAIRALDRLSLWVARITIVLTVLLAIGMVAVLVVGVFFRYVLQDSLSWTGEMAVFMFTWVTFLVASLGVREDFHVQITLVQGTMPPPLLKAARVIVSLFVLGVGAALAVSGYGGVQSMAGQVSAAVGYPLWLLYSAVPVGGVLICLHALARMVVIPVERPATSGGHRA